MELETEIAKISIVNSRLDFHDYYSEVGKSLDSREIFQLLTIAATSSQYLPYIISFSGQCPQFGSNFGWKMCHNLLNKSWEATS